MAWLPKDERRLLAAYASQMGGTGIELRFNETDLTDLLSCWWWKRQTAPEDGHREEKPEKDFESLKKGVARVASHLGRVTLANKHLAERELINVKRDSHDARGIVVSLTLEGYDLGRQYASLFDCSGVWFEQYKNHWLWFIAACIGGALVKSLFDFIGALIKG